MLISTDINAFFDIDAVDKKSDEIDMNVSNSDVDNMLDSILDATIGISHIWKEVDDDNTIPESKIFKTHFFPVEEYIYWIKGLEKAGLSYIQYDHQNVLGGIRKKNQ